MNGDLYEVQITVAHEQTATYYSDHRYPSVPTPDDLTRLKAEAIDIFEVLYPEDLPDAVHISVVYLPRMERG